MEGCITASCHPTVLIRNCFRPGKPDEWINQLLGSINYREDNKISSAVALVDWIWTSLPYLWYCSLTSDVPLSSSLRLFGLGVVWGPAVMRWPEGVVKTPPWIGVRSTLLALSLLLTCVSSFLQPLPRVFLSFEGKEMSCLLQQWIPKHWTDVSYI